MKIVCISNSDIFGKIKDLSKGKVYDLPSQTSNNFRQNQYNIGMGTYEWCYKIVDDSGQFSWFPEDKFITLEEFREEKLLKILE